MSSISLAMFVCYIAKPLSIALLDTGAVCNAISLSHANRSQIPIKRVPPRRFEHLLGYYDFIAPRFLLEIAEWRGKVEAIVQDLKRTYFDAVVGMQWFREWNPLADQ
jgi:hypothetical protein